MREHYSDYIIISFCKCLLEERLSIERNLAPYPDLELNFTDTCDLDVDCDLYILPSRELLALSRSLILESETPIIAFGFENQIHTAFSYHARDFITYPFSEDEMFERITKHAARSFCFQKDEFFSFSRSRLMYKDSCIKISLTEYFYLSCLTKAGGNPVSRELLGKGSNMKIGKDSRTPDNIISHIRKKFRQLLPIDRNLIKPVRGVGYRLERIS